VVVSDHGFGAIPDGSYRSWAFKLDTLLGLVDLDAQKSGITNVNNWGQLSLGVDRAAAGEHERVCAKLEALVADLRTSEGEPVLTGSVERSLTLQDPYFAVLRAAPNTAVLDALWPDGTVSIDGRSVRMSDLAEPNEFSGTHRFTGILIAAGGPIRRRTERLDAGVLDVAPLLFYLADRPIPDDLEGRLPRALFSTLHLLRHRPRSVAAASLQTFDNARTPVADADSRLDDQLRTLGYME
jgi:hypothetical protein